MKAFLALGCIFVLVLSVTLFADEYDDCTLAISSKSTSCTNDANTPSGADTAFKNGKNAICDLNYHALENVNHMLCFLKHKLKFDGSASGSATVGSDAYTWEFASTGLETFATDLGYSGKLTVKKGGVTQAIMWWDGSDESTKGYLISNKVGVELSNELAIYIQWDKSSTTQWVRYIRGTWDKTTNTNGPMDGGNNNVSRGKYGYMKYTTDTDKVNALEVTDVKTNAGSLACERQRIWGGA